MKTLKNIFVVFVCIFLIIPYQANSQNSNESLPPYEVKLNRDYLISYWKDSRDIMITPFRWDKKKWLTFSAVVGTGAVLYWKDKEICNFFQRNKTITTDNLSKYIFEPFGNFTYTLPALGVFYIYGLSSDKNRPKRVALNGVKSILLSGITVQVAKYIFNRQRPAHDNPPNPDVWVGPFSSEYDKAFPSGHATLAFSVATVIATEYKDVRWIPIVSYTIAGITALSRINDNYHWASDVFIGSALGFGIGKLICNNSFKRFQLSPITSFIYNGFSMVYQL